MIKILINVSLTTENICKYQTEFSKKAFLAYDYNYFQKVLNTPLQVL